MWSQISWQCPHLICLSHESCWLLKDLSTPLVFPCKGKTSGTPCSSGICLSAQGSLREPQGSAADQAGYKAVTLGMSPNYTFSLNLTYTREKSWLCIFKTPECYGCAYNHKQSSGMTRIYTFFSRISTLIFKISRNGPRYLSVFWLVM